MFYLDSQEKVATSPLRQELEGAKVVGVSEASNSPSTSGAASSARRKTKKKGRWERKKKSTPTHKGLNLAVRRKEINSTYT